MDVRAYLLQYNRESRFKLTETFKRFQSKRDTVVIYSFRATVIGVIPL